MNTRISYRYADKTNCKQYTGIVVEGLITWEQIAPYLVRTNSFIPGQIGLEDLQLRFALPGADHPWHQITPEDFKQTSAAPTVALSGASLMELFANTTWEPGQPAAVPFTNTTAAPGDTARAAGGVGQAALHTYADDQLQPAPDTAGPRARRTSKRSK